MAEEADDGREDDADADEVVEEKRAYARRSTRPARALVEKHHRVMSAGLSATVYEKLQRAARRESRSVATYVACLIERHMKKQRV